MRVLVVDDEPITIESIKILLNRRGIKDVTTCDNSRMAIDLIKKHDFDVVLLDIIMPEIDGIEILYETKPLRPNTEFIMLTAMDDIPTTVKAIRLGAYDYHVKPPDNERLVLSIQRAFEIRGLKSGLACSLSEVKMKNIPKELSSFKTQSQRVMELLSYTATMARSDLPILITGETGTGKELLAQAIHKMSEFSSGPFVPVNVAAIPEALFESQIFGHKKGAFTGAINNFTGFFEQANNGTLFLDEVGDLPYNLQAKMLRTLEERKITRLGGTKPQYIKIRVVSATNSDLEKLCKNGLFRLDLLYRIKSVHINLPPLRERNGDILYLAEYFLRIFGEKYEKDDVKLDESSKRSLVSYDFPGNVRELSQMLNKAVIAAESNIIYPEHLDILVKDSDNYVLEPDLYTLKENEEWYLIRVLKHTKGNKKKAAEILGITLRHFHRKVASMRDKPHWRDVFDDI